MTTVTIQDIRKQDVVRRTACARLLDVLDGESPMSGEEAMEFSNETGHASRED